MQTTDSVIPSSQATCDQITASGGKGLKRSTPSVNRADLYKGCIVFIQAQRDRPDHFAYVPKKNLPTTCNFEQKLDDNSRRTEYFDVVMANSGTWNGRLFCRIEKSMRDTRIKEVLQQLQGELVSGVSYESLLSYDRKLLNGVVYGKNEDRSANSSNLKRRTPMPPSTESESDTMLAPPHKILNVGVNTSTSKNPTIAMATAQPPPGDDLNSSSAINVASSDDIARILEALSNIQKKMDIIEYKLERGGFMEGLSNLEEKVDIVQQKVEENAIVLSSLETKMDTIEKKQTRLEDLVKRGPDDEDDFNSLADVVPFTTVQALEDHFDDIAFRRIVLRYLKKEGPKDLGVVRFLFSQLVSDGLLMNFIWPSNKSHHNPLKKPNLPKSFVRFVTRFCNMLFTGKAGFENQWETRVRRYINGSKKRYLDGEKQKDDNDEEDNDEFDEYGNAL